jgi:hypothetical protein
MTSNPYQSPATPETPHPRAPLLPVAIALAAVSLLWVFLALFGITFLAIELLSPQLLDEHRRINISYILFLSVSIGYSLLLTTGAFSMIRRGSYAWAVTISCLALVPLLGPCYVLAIPIGIWALAVLCRPEVRASFRRDALLARE